METIKVLVVDDHELVRRGVVEMLSGREGVAVVGEARDGSEAVAKALELSPDVVVMDLHMPVMGGLEATQALWAQVPTANILMLTVSEKEADLFGAMRAGSKGYLLKNAGPQELLRAIFQIAEGGVIVSSDMATKLLTELTVSSVPTAASESSAIVRAQLSAREAEVLQEVAKGASNNEIAATLVISENTVKTHLRNIMDKLHLANRSQAAAYAVRTGLHRLPDPKP